MLFGPDYPFINQTKNPDFYRSETPETSEIQITDMMGFRLSSR